MASAAGVSIASVSRVLNGRGNPMPETRDRVLAAVAELGFIPDGAARALSARLKEIIGVVIRRPPPTEPLGDDIFQDEEESLQFPDLINRGIELADQNRGLQPAGRARWTWTTTTTPAGCSRWPARVTG